MLALRATENTTKTPRRKVRNENETGTAAKRFTKTPLHTNAKHAGPSTETTVLLKGILEASTRPRRPLGDKTPGHNLRQITNPLGNGAPGGKDALSKPIFVDQDLLQSVARPSASRKNLKTPRFSLEKKAGLFRTPEPSGKNYWDVSDISIAEELAELSMQEEESPDYDEVEYMPPTAEVPSIAREYDLPDPKELGETLKALLYMPMPGPEYIISHDVEAFMIPESELRLSLPPPSPPPPRVKTATFKASAPKASSSAASIPKSVAKTRPSGLTARVTPVAASTRRATIKSEPAKIGPAKTESLKNKIKASTPIPKPAIKPVKPLIKITVPTTTTSRASVAPKVQPSQPKTKPAARPVLKPSTTTSGTRPPSATGQIAGTVRRYQSRAPVQTALVQNTPGEDIDSVPQLPEIEAWDDDFLFDIADD